MGTKLVDKTDEQLDALKEDTVSWLYTLSLLAIGVSIVLTTGV